MILIYLIVGLLVGSIGAMLGIGGGIFVVPLMTFVFGASPVQAVGTSLFVVMLNSFSGAFGYMRKKMVCLDAAWKFALATIPGALIGSYVSDVLSGDTLSAIFAIFFISLSGYMFFKSGSTPDTGSSDIPSNYNWKLGTSLSSVVGFLSSILGIGGGIVHVPMMTYLLKFPIKISIATSTAILFVSSVTGVLTHGCLGHILWLPAICIGSGAVIGAQAGVRIVGRVNSSFLVRLCAVFLFAVAVKFLFDCLAI